MRMLSRYVPRWQPSVKCRKLHNYERYGQGVANTLHKFLWCIDTNNPRDFAQLFTDNGKCEIVRVGACVQGRELLEGLCTDIHKRFTPALHLESNVMIDFVNASEATNRSYWSAVQGGEVISTGFHIDRLVVGVTDDGKEIWQFSHRLILHHWTKENGYVKNALSQFGKL